MAGQRKKPAPEYKIPEYYTDEHEVSESFQKAYNHAMKMGNSEKSAILYAEAHGEDDRWTNGEE